MLVRSAIQNRNSKIQNLSFNCEIILKLFHSFAVYDLLFLANHSQLSTYL